MPLIRLLQRFSDLVKRVEMGLIVLAVPVMMVMGALQILSRFIIQQPMPWSEGLLTFLFVWTSHLRRAVPWGHHSRYSGGHCP